MGSGCTDVIHMCWVMESLLPFGRGWVEVGKEGSSSLFSSVSNLFCKKKVHIRKKAFPYE